MDWCALKRKAIVLGGEEQVYHPLRGGWGDVEVLGVTSDRHLITFNGELSPRKMTKSARTSGGMPLTF